MKVFYLLVTILALAAMLIFTMVGANYYVKNVAFYPVAAFIGCIIAGMVGFAAAGKVEA
jgi:hypothetical protein